MFLARKITRSKWERREGLELGEFPADAATSDLRTTENALSTWACRDEEELDCAVLALVSGADRVERLDLVWVERQPLEVEGISFRETDGRTPVRDLVERHVDAVRLDCVRLAVVAAHFGRSIEQGRFRRFPKRRLVDLLVRAVVEGRLVLGDLNQGVAREVEARLRIPGGSP